MSIQFAGSKSQDDRRRRRLVVNSDDPGADGTGGEEGLSAGKVTSELVASSAAAPWVPVHEWRLWTYSALMGLVLSGAAFALAMPMSFRPELAPLTQHLLEGERPVLAVLIQTTLCFLAAQLCILIAWYRAQCKLDFRGYYRVWPWAAITFAIAAICSATNIHGLLGQIIESSQLLPWRPRVISWLLPACVTALPLILLLDRDVRRGRSSLYTLRVAWLLGVIAACLELFSVELQSQPWATRARVILPMFVMATVFVGLWLHARVVAYICPDPPEAAETSAISQLMAVCRWIASKLVWRRKVVAAEAETKPKRGRKKTATEEEEETPKRKRRTPAKKPAKPRTRKVAEVEEEEEVEQEEESYSEDASDASENYEAEEAESNEWEEEEEEAPPPPPPVRNNRESAPSPQYSTPKKPNNSGWNQSEASDEESEDEEDSGDATLRHDDGSDPMKGLSKRQKRELRRQTRDQQRNQRR